MVASITKGNKSQLYSELLNKYICRLPTLKHQHLQKQTNKNRLFLQTPKHYTQQTKLAKRDRFENQQPVSKSLKESLPWYLALTRAEVWLRSLPDWSPLPPTSRMFDGKSQRRQLGAREAWRRPTDATVLLITRLWWGLRHLASRTSRCSWRLTYSRMNWNASTRAQRIHITTFMQEMKHCWLHSLTAIVYSLWWRISTLKLCNYFHQYNMAFRILEGFVPYF